MEINFHTEKRVVESDWWKYDTAWTATRIESDEIRDKLAWFNDEQQECEFWENVMILFDSWIYATSCDWCFAESQLRQFIWLNSNIWNFCCILNRDWFELKLAHHHNDTTTLWISRSIKLMFYWNFTSHRTVDTLTSMLSKFTLSSRSSLNETFIIRCFLFWNRARVLLVESREEAAYNFNFVRLQWRLLALYRILLSVRNRIHWGIGRFCLSFLASFCLILNVLWDDMVSLKWRLRRLVELRWRIW